MAVDKAVLENPNTIVQSEIHVLDNGRTPEAIIKAKAGFIITNDLGELYVKSTNETLATGWKKATLT